MRKRVSVQPKIGIFAAATLALLALGLVRGTRSYAVVTGDPMSVVKTVVNQALSVLDDKQTPLAERQDKLRTLVDANFDFATMSRSALGYHWRGISDQQRKDFTHAFTAFVQDSYLSRMQDYSVETVNFLRARNEGPGYAQVMTKVVQPGKEPVPVDYMLRRNDTKWLIYDVTVDNISIIANYRNQFNRVVNNKGFDALLNDLKSKQAKLAARLGTERHAD